MDWASRTQGVGGEASQRACLVVDDSPGVRQVLVAALAGIPALRVVEATDGADAVRRLASGRFDLVVTDLNMPVLDGLKLVAYIRADAVHRDVPVVVVTTERGAEDRRRAMALGANRYLTKPVESVQLVAAARELLRLA